MPDSAIDLSNLDIIFGGVKASNYLRGDIGVQISKDGRVWVCINGIACIRSSPHPDGKMVKEPK